MGSSKEFLDVTLTSEDNISFQAHKVILAATSIFFRDNFNRNEGANYVIGVNSRFMASMLDIIYFGETKIEAESCTTFIRFLQDCKMLEPEMFRTRNEKQKYYKVCNVGFCREGPNCLYDHPSRDCQPHITSGKCTGRTCILRHRKVCKFWASGWCKREDQCAFLHRRSNHSGRSSRSYSSRRSSKSYSSGRSSSSRSSKSSRDRRSASRREESS